MITALRGRFPQRQLTTWLVAAAVLVLAALLGHDASPLWLGLLAAGIGAALVLARPVLALPALIVAAVAVPISIGTGTEVKLNVASLLVPVLLVIWLLNMLRRRHIHIAPSRANLPLLLFLAAGLLSLWIGRIIWDPMVPVGGSFLLVQLAQWAIFAFSAGAFWLMANLVKDETWLRRTTVVFLIVGGSLAILATLPGLGGLSAVLFTTAVGRTPFWMLLAALIGGQLLFNQRLSAAVRVTLWPVLIAIVYLALGRDRAGTSFWLGICSALGVLLWLRFRGLRWLAIALLVVLIGIGVLFSTLYEFAGGDTEWEASGGSRLVLIERVVEVTMRNPITGLGPAAYRPYANMKPLRYVGANWVTPQINSHNNYVDLFAHVGVVGLLLFFWFVAEIARLGVRLRRRYTQGFSAGYINGVLGTGLGSLVIMMFADWILPFVYNIGFHGFQASMLVWLFMGGLVALDNMPADRADDRLPAKECG